jgi:diaminopimelate decarboxylase
MPQATREDTRFSLTDAEAWELAAKFGTPLYVLDENTLRAKIQRYRSAMLKAWP